MRTCWLSLALPTCLTLMSAAPAAEGDLAHAYVEQIHPLLVTTCGNCHGKDPQDNDLDLTSFGTAEAILTEPDVLAAVAERLRDGDMPPRDAPQPSGNGCSDGSRRRSTRRPPRGPETPGR